MQTTAWTKNGRRCAFLVDQYLDAHPQGDGLEDPEVRDQLAAADGLSLIAQTAPCEGTNVKTTLCASVRNEQVTLRMGRKR
jgi:hypothetical protein